MILIVIIDSFMKNVWTLTFSMKVEFISDVSETIIASVVRDWCTERHRYRVYLRGATQNFEEFDHKKVYYRNSKFPPSPSK
jgi:hypothetical protein